MCCKPRNVQADMLARPTTRFWNIAFRTLHIGALAPLVGGHVFNIPAPSLVPWLTATIGTGLVLMAIETGLQLKWFYQGRGLAVLGKLALLGLIPIVWNVRVAILMTVIVIASVGSHMPGRFRYYSVLHGRVLD